MAAMDLRQMCRTCLKTNNNILPHFDLEDECIARGRTYYQLLKEYSQIKFNTVHEAKMPRGICAMCSGELKRIYVFIAHAHECNKKLMNMLTHSISSGSKEDAEDPLGNMQDVMQFIVNADNVDVKNEPIPHDDIMMKYTEATYHTDDSRESDDGLLNNQSREKNVRLRYDPPTMSYTNHMHANETQNVIEAFTETQKQILEHITILRDNQEKMLGVITKSSESLPKASLFPIKDDKELRYANEFAKDNFNDCVNILQQIMSDDGLHRSFHRLFTSDITMSYNYDGKQNKKCLKQFKFLHKAIYASMAKEGYTYEDYIKDLRISIRLCKNRLFKKKHDLNKKQSQINVPL